MNMIVLYTSIFIPLQIGFRLEMSIFTLITYVIIDIFYLFDIYLQFFTAYFDGAVDSYVYDVKLIAAKYMKSWFSFDILATFPFEVIIPICFGIAIYGESTTSSGHDFVRGFLALKLLRLHKLNDLNLLLDDFRVNRSYINAQSVLFRMLFIAHVVACFWNFIGSHNDNNSGSSTTSQIPLICTSINQTFLVSSAGKSSSSNSGTSTGATWIQVQGLAGSSVIDRYAASLYWAMMTLLTVGYGDISATNTKERAYSICAGLLGAILFGAIIADVSNVISKMDPKRRNIKLVTAELMGYLMERPLPTTLIATAKVCTLLCCTLLYVI